MVKLLYYIVIISSPHKEFLLLKLELKQIIKNN